MYRFLLRRVLQSLVVLWAVATFVFFLIRLSGDPVQLMAPENATAQDIATLRHGLGLDRPLIVQYGDYLGSAVTGDLGQSIHQQGSALGLVLERMPATLELTGIALVVTILVAVPIGVLSARYPNSWLDQIARGFAVLGQSVPVFWLGILLILLFSVRFHVLPAFGSGGLTHALLPGVTLAAYSVPITTRMLRSNLIEVLNGDYIRTARSKGISGRTVLVSHGLRNAALPVMTVFALRVGTLLGGSVVAEQVFAYPGLGQLALRSISDRDYPVLQAFVLLVALLIVGVNLLMDVLYAVLDPRIRVG